MGGPKPARQSALAFITRCFKLCGKRRGQPCAPSRLAAPEQARRRPGALQREQQLHDSE